MNSRHSLRDPLQEAFKNRYDPLDPARETGQELVDGGDRHRRTFIERYAAREVGVYAFVRVRVGDDYVAVIYRSGGSMELDARLDALRSTDPREIEIRRGQRDPAVLVDPVQVVQDPEAMPAVAVAQWYGCSC